MPQTPGPDGGIKTTRTTFAIVETLHEREAARLTELAAAVDIANSTAHEHLETLEGCGYVVEDEGLFSLSLKFLDHGTRAKRRYQGLIEAAKPALEGLIDETNETMNLVVEEHGEAVYVDRMVGERGVPTNSWAGKRKPLHTLAAGKSILAHLPDERVDEIVSTRGLAAVTERTITTREQLEDELETIRDRGVAFNDRESHDRIRAVGTPIVLEGEVFGGIAIAGPAKRLTGEYFRSELPDLLLGAVNEIELKLAYH